MLTSSDPASGADAPPVTAYIRTLNEERMIGAVISAARAAAREIIIVDCGSTDRTREIAEAAGARVIDQPWLGNGRQKRVGEEAARNDWLLDLDADEVLSPQLAEAIKAVFAQGEPAHDVYEMTLVTVPPVGAPWEGFALDPRRKLYDRRKHRMPDHKAWDQLEIPKAKQLPRLDGALFHHSFRDFEQYMAKWNRVSSVRSRETKLKPLWQLKLRILFAPPFYFLRHYLLRGLWRAGFYGFAIARGVAFGRWMRDVKMYEIHRGLKK
ncbi:MAG: glycosyltransferase family 2 protein [Neomegalonema sp.]|nr:glycosyltransferase family 2 protein [Neomegalonema sp.]